VERAVAVAWLACSAQLDRMPADTLPTGLSVDRLPPARRARLPGLRAVATLMVWVLLIAGSSTWRGWETNVSAKSPAPSASASAQGFGQDASHSTINWVRAVGSYPTLGAASSSADTAAPPVPAGTGGFAFLQMNRASPVAYDALPANSLRDSAITATPAGGDQTVRLAVLRCQKPRGSHLLMTE